MRAPYCTRAGSGEEEGTEVWARHAPHCVRVWILPLEGSLAEEAPTSTSQELGPVRLGLDPLCYSTLWRLDWTRIRMKAVGCPGVTSRTAVGASLALPGVVSCTNESTRDNALSGTRNENKK